MNDEPLLITVEEASKLLNMGRNTLLKIIKTSTSNSKFPAIILPHKILIDKNQLPIWIAKNYGTFKN